ncbi:cobyric acid synthase [Natronoarchaeum sp. GCM10025703]|uniref:cobyric acid synthase n=1 Tax=unclassified Natronoarchaeum TaxID=2620183 RepID=UPI003623FAC3
MTATGNDPPAETPTLLVAGTASHVGKSTVAAGICRLLSDRGVDVAPFKAQNMSNNARVVPHPESIEDGSAGSGEIGVSQYVQCRAARRPPTTDVNPVLLKPRGDGESQIVLDGEAVGHYAAGEYYDEHWERARDSAVDAHRRLAADADIVVAEGAGGMGEINLHHRDLANVETARFTDATILLVADIERGGAFASLVGTLTLMPDDLREQVGGAVITKFRGDRSILDPGIAEFEERTGVPVLGVVPYDDPGLPAEDSVSLPAPGERSVRGADDGVPDDGAVTVAVPRLPRISNFTDLEPLAREPGVRVSYWSLDASVRDADALVLPGTKNTVDDLLALREAGFDEEIRQFDGPIVGLCGGYQLLGERITNAAVEGTGEQTTVEAVGLLPVETAFSPEKRLVQVSKDIAGVGPLDGATGRVSGYEIHMGETALTESTDRPFAGSGAAIEQVLGTYLHGLFENGNAREAFLESVFEAAGTDRPDRDGSAGSAYNRAGALIDEHVALDRLDPIRVTDR